MTHLDGKIGERAEAVLVIRWASRALNDTERYSLQCWLEEGNQTEAAKKRGITRAAMWQAQKSGLQKMRRKLLTLGIRSSSQLLG